MLATLLTIGSFGVVMTHLIWGPAVPVALVVLAIAQMGVHLIFFLHITTGPDNTNNVLALAFGVLVVGLVVVGSHLDHGQHGQEHGADDRQPDACRCSARPRPSADSPTGFALRLGHGRGVGTLRRRGGGAPARPLLRRGAGLHRRLLAAARLGDGRGRRPGHATVAFETFLPQASKGLVDAAGRGPAHAGQAWIAWAIFVSLYLGFAVMRNMSFFLIIPLSASAMREMTNEGVCPRPVLLRQLARQHLRRSDGAQALAGDVGL